ncbi:hypothetical protein ABZ914_10035 [Spirillospora sp. NPDC046719]
MTGDSAPTSRSRPRSFRICGMPSRSSTIWKSTGTGTSAGGAKPPPSSIRSSSPGPSSRNATGPLRGAGAPPAAGPGRIPGTMIQASPSVSFTSTSTR